MNISITQMPRTLENLERLIMQPGSEKLRLRVSSDDSDALEGLFAASSYAEFVGSIHQRPADFAFSDEGAADLLEQTRSNVKKREECHFDDHDEYEWQIAFVSQEARGIFIQWCRWIGAAITETGIAIPSGIAREIAAIMRP